MNVGVLMKTFFEWLEHADEELDSWLNEKNKGFHLKVKEAEENSEKTGLSHSVVLLDGEYIVVPTASIEVEPNYQGKVVYTASVRK